jgi:hypothetical protein
VLDAEKFFAKPETIAKLRAMSAAMTAKDKAEQVASLAYGNLKLHRPNITIDEVRKLNSRQSEEFNLSNPSKDPTMFDRIVRVGKPDILKKYAATFEGKSETDTATIAEGRLLAEELSAKSMRYRNGMGLPTPLLIANGGGLGETYFDAEEMVREGFPADKPIHLHLRYDMGTFERMIEVHDAAYWIATKGETGYRRIYNDLDRG